jgi:FAD/FMN-containing dehydrogenase
MLRQRLTDQFVARRMLKLRDQGGPTLGSSLHARRYGFLFLIFVTGLASLAANNMWSFFAALAGVGVGVLIRDVGSMRTTRRAWAFTNKVIDWKLVEELADQGSPAHLTGRPATVAMRILGAISKAIVLVLVAGAIFVLRPGYLWFSAWLDDRPARLDMPAGYLDDASRLNQTKLTEVWSMPADAGAAESQLKDILQRARSEGLKVSIAGARHSMGGHTIYPGGIVLDMLPFHRMEIDDTKRILRVGAGARWTEIIPYLDARGLSVAVMQSNDDFSVGGSISVNCHGWQHDHQPIASTVESLRLMKGDGSIVDCSRREEKELFSLVLGGYGLFGVILEVELHVVANERYHAESEVVAADQYVARFLEKVRGKPDVGMVYGRLSIVPGETFLKEAILTVFRRAPCKREEIPQLGSTGLLTLRREVFRAQIGSGAGKEIRWQAEKTFGEQFASRYVSRNQLLNEGAGNYQEHNADRTDILHEYFIPPDRVAAFLDQARAIIPKHHGDLLNVTIRNILEDRDTFLRYADQEMFAFVMLFSQPRTRDADTLMEPMTRELIDAAVACGGRYYLPYRLHATKHQMAQAYPRAAAFFERKRHFDPEEIFQNQFYVKYGRP